MDIIQPIIDKISALLTNSSASNRKSLIYVGILIIVKKYYGYIALFDVLITLLLSVLCLFVLIDIGEGVDPITSTHTRNISILSMITYFIAKTPHLNNTSPIGMFDFLFVKSQHSTLNIPQVNIYKS